MDQGACTNQPTCCQNGEKRSTKSLPWMSLDLSRGSYDECCEPNLHTCTSRDLCSVEERQEQATRLTSWPAGWFWYIYNSFFEVMWGNRIEKKNYGNFCRWLTYQTNLSLNFQSPDATAMQWKKVCRRAQSNLRKGTFLGCSKNSRWGQGVIGCNRQEQAIFNCQHTLVRCIIYTTRRRNACQS